MNVMQSDMFRADVPQVKVTLTYKGRAGYCATSGRLIAYGKTKDEAIKKVLEKYELENNQ